MEFLIMQYAHSQCMFLSKWWPAVLQGPAMNQYTCLDWQLQLPIGLLMLVPHRYWYQHMPKPCRHSSCCCRQRSYKGSIYHCR